MELEVGSILEGKVTGITKFGAFVGLPNGKSGLVHISEIANTFVSDVHDHVQVGEPVKVMVLKVTDDGKVNLSIKRTQTDTQRSSGMHRDTVPAAQPQHRAENYVHAAPVPAERTEADGPSDDQAFEARLKKFLQEADSKIADSRRYAEHRQRSRRR